MTAIIKHGGKQYKVSEGDILRLDYMGLEPKSKIEIKEVLAVEDGDDLKIGTPYVDGAVVEAEVINEGRERKIIIYKKRRRIDSKLNRCFSRDLTLVGFTKIS
jgi:large subunit ribosomal protein L21